MHSEKLESEDAAKISVSTQIQSADDQADFLTGWLTVVATALERPQKIIVMVEDTTGRSFRPVAIWPDADTDATDLEDVISQAVELQGNVSRHDKAGNGVHVASAVGFDGHIPAVVAVAAEGQIVEVERTLSLAIGWIASRLWEQRSVADREEKVRAVSALEALAVAAEGKGLWRSSMSLCAQIATKQPFLRVSFGFAKGRGGLGSRVRLMAMSGSAWFRKRGKLVGLIQSAMEEALDQGETVIFPATEGTRSNVDIACAAARDALGSDILMMVPVFDDGRPVGVLMAECEADLAASDIADFQAVAALAGPVLAIKRKQYSLFAGRLVDGTTAFMDRLSDRQRPSWRVAAFAILFVVSLPFFWIGEHRINADARLEAVGQQSVIAPFAGFVAETFVRPGDLVEVGEALLRLDDRDLKLESERWRAELERLDREARIALSSGNQAERRLIATRIAQANAEFKLAVAKLERTLVAATVSGTVIEGDFSQRLGAPVERGEFLFLIAPSDEYRAIIDVDARDIDLLSGAQTGTIALAARPREPIAIKISSINAVSRVEDGQLLFRAEASVLESDEEWDPDHLLPGMEGAARINVGTASLARIWSRRLSDWIRLQIFRWRP